VRFQERGRIQNQKGELKGKLPPEMEEGEEEGGWGIRVGEVTNFPIYPVVIGTINLWKSGEAKEGAKKEVTDKRRRKEEKRRKHAGIEGGRQRDIAL